MYSLIVHYSSYSVCVDLYKALDQSQKKAKQLEHEQEMLKERLKRIDEERKKREKELKKERNEAVETIQACCLQVRRKFND